MGMTRANATYLGAGLAVLITALVATPVGAAPHPPLTTKAGVVAADNPVASRVGAGILARGGSAADAAVGTALALGVVSPASSGLGGGGFALVYVAREKKVYAIDFREVGPAAIRPALFRDKSGKVVPMRSRVGGLAVGVPGEPAGLEAVWQHGGRLAWADDVEPARVLADRGFVVGWFVGRATAAVAARAGLAVAAPSTYFGRWLRPGGTLIAYRRVVRRSALARTLAYIARKGAAGFYSGWIGKDLVAADRAGGGVLTVADLEGYRAVVREPLWGRFHGHRIATMPLPSSGGIAILEALGILDATGIDLKRLGPGSSAALHLEAESLKNAFADRARFLGDASAARSLVDALLAPARLARLAHHISMKHTLPSARYGTRRLPGAAGAGGAVDDHGTSHLCVVDAQGDAVAMTTTVNGYFGSMLVGKKSGVVLNDQIDDFAMAAGVPNMFGLVQSEANLVGPGKRPLSSMSPTLVFDGDKVVACVGGSGGPKIISDTFQVLVNVLVFGMNASQAVAAPRIHHQWKPDSLMIEDDVPRDVMDNLKRRGHHLVPLEGEITAEQLIVVEPDGTREAASDPRKGGRAAAQDDVGARAGRAAAGAAPSGAR